MNRTAAWLIEQLKRDDLPPDVRKRYKNRLKMQKPRKPSAPDINKRHPHYTLDAWKKISRRRKLSQAAKRRNRQ